MGELIQCVIHAAVVETQNYVHGYLDAQANLTGVYRCLVRTKKQVSLFFREEIITFFVLIKAKEHPVSQIRYHNNEGNGNRDAKEHCNAIDRKLFAAS